MGKTKELFEREREQEILGEEHRAYVHWLEEENYWRYQPNRGNKHDRE